MPTTANSKVPGVEVLEAAAQRNAAVEIHCADRAGEQTVIRTRLLAIDEEQIMLAHPAPSANIPLRRGSQLEIYFVFREQLFSFKARIIEIMCTVELAGEMEAPALAISRPQSVGHGQRRDSFRVSLATNAPISCAIHPACLEGNAGEFAASTPIDATPFVGTIADISAGGAGVRVESEALRAFEVGGYAFLSFALPEADESMVFLVQIRQKRSIAEDTAGRIGVAFQPWPSARLLRHHQNKLQRFVREVERAKLKRAG